MVASGDNTNSNGGVKRSGIKSAENGAGEAQPELRIRNSRRFNRHRRVLILRREAPSFRAVGK